MSANPDTADKGFYGLPAAQVGLPGTDDWVRLSLSRLLGKAVDPATLTDDEDDLWLHPSLNCDPVRTGVAMVLSVGLALGAALVGRGHFTTQLTVWRQGVLADPARVIAETKIPPAARAGRRTRRLTIS